MSSIRFIDEVAALLARELCQSEPPLVGGDPAVVTRAIASTLKANFDEEAAIGREAEQALESMGPASRGMDRGKLLEGIRERLAKQRGFVL